MKTNNVLAVAGLLLIGSTVYTNFIDIPEKENTQIITEYHPSSPIPAEPMIPIDKIDVIEQEPINEIKSQTASIEMDKIEEKPVQKVEPTSTQKKSVTTTKKSTKKVTKSVSKKVTAKPKKGFNPYVYTTDRHFLIIPEGINAEFNRVR